MHRFDDDPPPWWLKTFGDMREWDGASTPGPRCPEDTRTPKQRRRAKRDTCILVCLKAGLSRRFVAEAFGLPRSLVQEIGAAGTPDRSKWPRPGRAGPEE